MEQNIFWVPGRNGEVSERAVVGGKERYGEPLYVGRFMVSGDVVPGKITPSHGVCYVPFCWKEHKSSEYEYLIQPPKGKLKWKWTEGGMVPGSAVPGGYTKRNETLYIGRAYHMGSLVIGKVHPSERCAYIPYSQEELKVFNYEVLTYED